MGKNATFNQKPVGRGLLVALVFSLVTVLTACQPEELTFTTLATSFERLDTSFNYREEKPALFVIAGKEEIATYEDGILVNQPELVDLLARLDYEQEFAVLIAGEYGGSTGILIDVEQIRKENNQVDLHIKYPDTPAGTRVLDLLIAPYHLIAVAKKGKWSDTIIFNLIHDETVVAHTTHFIP
jgi:hypothetical protein